MNIFIPSTIAALFVITNKSKSASKEKSNSVSPITVALYKSYAGKPGIIVGNYGKGKVLLFSPNPILGNPKRDDMFVNGIKYVSRSGKVKNSIRFSDVF